MTNRSMLRALVAGMALCTAAVPASAEPTTFEQCLRDVDCVAVSADTNGDVSGSAGGACAPEALVALCLPGVTAGTTGGPISSGPSHRVDTWCRWGGSPGSRIDVEGRLTPVPPAGVTAVSMSLSCQLRVNGATRTTAAGVPWQGGLWAHKTDTSTNRGDHVIACLAASVQWSDGTRTDIASGGNCLTHS